MHFFISGEIDSEIGELFTPIMKEIELILNTNLYNKSYSAEIDEISLIPIILGPRFPDHKERRLLKRKAKGADYRLHVDFNSFLNGSEQDRKILLIKNLLEAIADIKLKLKNSFDADSFKNDILLLFPYAV
ncbi:MAG TPA: Imm44 family immunity protein [Candidatus Paceibacterota bacterium]